MRIIAFVSGVSLLLLLAGCGGDARDGKPSPAKNADQDKSVSKVAPPQPKEVPLVLPSDVLEPKLPVVKAAAAGGSWATVKGRIVGVGQFPKREPVKINPMHNDRLFCLKNGEFLDEEWIVDPKTKGLKNVFVWLAPADKEGKLSIHPDRAKIAASDEKVVIDQPICMFVPHAVALREGQTLVVKNTSKVLHNFNWAGDGEINKGGNFGIEAGGERELTIKAHPMLINLSCQIHPWMRGSMLCFDHPYFAVTDEQGRFAIKEAPTGPCRLMIRHSTGYYLGGRKGRDGGPITIEAVGSGDLGAIEFPAPPPPS